MCSETGNLNINERDGDGLTALYYAVAALAVRFTETKLRCWKVSVHWEYLGDVASIFRAFTWGNTQY